LEELNDTWQSSFGEWDEVEPPRFSADVPSTIDWRFFMDDVYLSDALKWKGDACRRSDPLRRPILAHVAAPTYGGTRVLGNQTAWFLFNTHPRVSNSPSLWQASNPQLTCYGMNFQELLHGFESKLSLLAFVLSCSRTDSPEDAACSVDSTNQLNSDSI